MLVSQFNDLDTTAAIVSAHKDEIAAVIVEPLQRTIAPEPGFLEGLRKITADAGLLLIFDEIVTGFRLAYGGAQEYYGVTPDMCTVGKIMGGGYPLAALLGNADVMSVYDRAAVSADDYVATRSAHSTGSRLLAPPVLPRCPSCARKVLTTVSERWVGVSGPLWWTPARMRDSQSRAWAKTRSSTSTSPINPSGTSVTAWPPTVGRWHGSTRGSWSAGS